MDENVLETKNQTSEQAPPQAMKEEAAAASNQNMAKGVQQRNKGLKLKGKLLLISLLPLIVLSAVIFVICFMMFRDLVDAEVKKGLATVAVSMEDTFVEQDSGDWHLEGDQLYKGERNVSEEIETVDHVKKASGYVSTVFYGDTRYLTSVLNEDGSRSIGTKAGENVVEAVLEKGQNYESEDVEILGELYYAYYLPLYNEGEEKPVGMLFVGASQASIEKKINTCATIILVICLVGVAFCVLLVWVVLNFIIKAIGRGIGFLEDVAGGDLTKRLENKYVTRADEIGNLSRSLTGLQDQLVDIVRGIQNQTDELAGASDTMKMRMNETTDNVT